MADLRYPLSIDNNKNLQLARHPLAEKAYSVIATVRGERVYRPEYGCPFTVFDPNTKLPSELSAEGLQFVLTELSDSMVQATIFEVVP